MRRDTLFLALLFPVAAYLSWRWRLPVEKYAPHNPKDIARVEPSPVSPWRNPTSDLLALFPTATNYVMESRIITGVMVPVQQRLGRQLNPDENPLRVFRAIGPDGHAGSVLVTRVKGEHGGIEIVTGVETNGNVRGVLIQSQREPSEIADAITNASWLAGFNGKTANSALRLGSDLADVPATVRVSAQAVADGVRHQLVVMAFAEMPVDAREFGRQTDP